METEILSNSNDSLKLWSELSLHEFADKFVIKSVESPDQGFSINRLDGNFDKLDGDKSDDCPGSPKVLNLFAETIRLLAGTYVLVITYRKDVGDYLGFPVFRVTSMKFLSCNEDSRNLTNQEKRDEDYFVTLLKIVESTPGLYYSYGTDITLNLQRRCKLAKGWESKPIWKQGDPQFVWNRNLLEELIEYKVRGSIPLLWEQIVDLSYKPRLHLINHEQTSEVVERHFNDLLKRYGGCIVVDLTDKHGDEGMLNTAYAEEMRKLPTLRYVPFDFHQSWAMGTFDTIHLLYDQVFEDFERQG